jgi:hypothetical protein
MHAPKDHDWRYSTTPFAELISGDSWHPLSGQPAPIYVPPYWTGPHVGLRLIEGLRTLRLMPKVSGPQQFGNSWPAWSFDWADLLAQQEREQEERQREERAQNRTRVRASSTEIAQMEAAIAWPMSYLAAFPQLLRTVQVCALVRSNHRDLEHAARKLGLPGRLCRRWNREGLDTIARGLRADRFPVF